MDTDIDRNIQLKNAKLIIFDMI